MAPASIYSPRIDARPATSSRRAVPLQAGVPEVVVALAGLALAASLAVLALPGRALVPGAIEGSPRWLMGVFGEGIGYGSDRYLMVLFVAIALWAVFALGLGSRDDPRARRALWFLITALVAIFTLAPPLHSLDVFSYISYGRLDSIAGLNPYDHGPAVLFSDPVADRVEDFRFTPSSYGPLFTLLSMLLAKASPGFALWSLKAIAGLSVLALTWLTMRIARIRGVPQLGAAAFVALNPLTLAHVVGGAHNDGLMVALALAGALAVLTARPVSGGVAIVAAAAVKVTAGLYAPFALAGARGERRNLFIGMAAATVVVALVALAFFGTSALGAIGVVGENQEKVSRWSVPGTLDRITGIDVDVLRPIFAVGFLLTLGALLVWTARGADWIRAAGWATFGLLIATSWMTPWYLIWLLPLAAVSRDRVLIVLTVLLTFFQAANGI